MNAKLPDFDEQQATPLRRRRHPRVMRHGWLLMLLGFGGFVIWAAWAPLDGGVALEGTVTSAGYRKLVQPAVAGVVMGLPVRDGDDVRAGQVLVELDARAARAEALAARLHHTMARAAVVRLRAEQRGQDTLAFPDTLSRAADSDPALAAVLALQRELFENRRGALTARRKRLEESLAGARARLEGQQRLAETQHQRLALMDQRLAALRPLAEGNYVPRNRLLELRESRAGLEGDLAATEAAVRGARATLGETRAELQGLEQEHRRQVRQELAEQELELARREEQLAVSGVREEQTRLRAPVNGRIVGQTLHTVGASVRPGDVLMEILPADEPLWVDVRVPVDRVDSVQAGQPVELMFTALNSSRTPRLEGEMARVSADRLRDTDSGEPYYSARVRVPSEAVAGLRGAEIRPGMPVQVFARTGERSLLNYLFKPLIDRLPLALEGT